MAYPYLTFELVLFLGVIKVFLYIFDTFHNLFGPTNIQNNDPVFTHIHACIANSVNKYMSSLLTLPRCQKKCN